MKVIKELELFLHEEINKDILIFNRKKSNVFFIAHKYINIDKKCCAYYVTCISKEIIEKFKNLETTFSEILFNSKVIFYVISNINSKESVSINKVSIADIEITDIMSSNEPMDKRVCEDFLVSEIEETSDNTGKIDLAIEEKFTYYVDMIDGDEDKLLHDDLVYSNNEDEDDDDEEEDDEESEDDII